MEVLKEIVGKILFSNLVMLALVVGVTLFISLLMWTTDPILGVLSFHEHELGWEFFRIFIFTGTMSGLLARKGEMGPR